MFEFFIKNKLISQKHSGFKLFDSFISQLLTATQEIKKFFDACRDIKVVFLDISKAFVKGWHRSLLYKLKQENICFNLPKTLTDLLKNQKQKVVLNWKNSS